VAILVLFVDGVGVGPPDPDTNPLARFGLPALCSAAGISGLTSDVVQATTDGDSGLYAIDATLGVRGLPQSGTGQTSLLTGMNAAQLLGKHHGPYPGAGLKPLLAWGTWWHQALEAGTTAAFANAYPDRYLERAAAGRGRMGAFARSAVLAGVRLRGPSDLAAGDAVSAFITNEGWREHLGYAGIPPTTPEAAGRVLASLCETHALVVFEFYGTDIAGHEQDWASAARWLGAFDEMARSALDSLPNATTLLVVSDHGNLEDMTDRRHTTNPALCIWLGDDPPGGPLDSLIDVAPAVRRATVRPRPDPYRSA
jgi:hypothetical protein